MVAHLTQEYLSQLDMPSTGKPNKPRRAHSFGITHEDGSEQLTLSRQRTPTVSRKVLFWVGFLFLCIMWNCTPQKVIENARARGAQAGYKDGLNAGDAEGYEAAFPAAEKAAYTAILNELYSTGQYRRTQVYTLGVLIGAFLLGFSLQYLLLYLLRKAEYLYDIDRIVLRKRATEVDLANLSVSLKHLPTPQEGPKISSSGSDT